MKIYLVLMSRAYEGYDFPMSAHRTLEGAELAARETPIRSGEMVDVEEIELED